MIGFGLSCRFAKREEGKGYEVTNQKDLSEGDLSKPSGFFLGKSPKPRETNVAAEVFDGRDKRNQIN